VPKKKKNLGYIHRSNYNKSNKKYK